MRVTKFSELALMERPRSRKLDYSEWSAVAMLTNLRSNVIGVQLAIAVAESQMQLSAQALKQR